MRRRRKIPERTDEWLKNTKSLSRLRHKKKLNEIKSYFTNVLKTSSNSVFEKFLEQVKILKTHPFTYSVHQDPLLKLIGYRVIPIDNYLMFYVVKGNVVQIHRVLYAKRNYMLLLGFEK